MFKKVLIANRGAIACRILRTLKKMGVASVAVYSEADRHSGHVLEADEAVCLGPAPAAASYLKADKLLEVARAVGAEAIHPGYGFLSENAAFAESCAAAGVVFIGPSPQQMREFGLKHTARSLAAANNVPMLPGSGLLDDVEHARREAERIGYPVMLKSTAGGGGIGMQLCFKPEDLEESFASVERLAKNNFSQGGLFLEKYVEQARHIEVQIFGDGRGTVVALGERDCSVQRRNQKVIEETPAPGLSAETRAALFDAAVRLGQAVGYQSAGTVEFVFDVQANAFYFLEVNTRLQVEHGVTEQVTGIDLVEWMIRVAAGEESVLAAENRPEPVLGHSVQVRLYAEDPGKNFQPASGLLTQVKWPAGIRIDTWIETGTDVPSYYDPMLAKLISHGRTRKEAIDRLAKALVALRVDGIETNQAYLGQVLDDTVFREGRQTTRYLGQFAYRPLTVDVLQAGTHTTIQDYPGRVGYWDIGVPPSGPMDALSFRLANRLLDNPETAAGLEITVTGPTLKFNTDTWIALTGAQMKAEIEGQAVPFHRAIGVKAGSVLKLRGIQGAGQRTYLAVRGGFDTPLYMGSRATFTLGQFGGQGGRALRVGDVLRLFNAVGSAPPLRSVPPGSIPPLQSRWEIGVLYGPHGAPDFFTQKDIDVFFATDWEVHYNSSRTGVRLIGPKPQWARRDGGEAGLHPSNIHDNAYAIGSIDFTGDMPVILGPDGPSLGGFVCPATIVAAELWKIGQLKPGDRVRFRPTTIDAAVTAERALDAAVRTLDLAQGHAPWSGAALLPLAAATVAASPVLKTLDVEPTVCYRQAGDKYLLVEYGPAVLDLELRFRVHALMTWLQAQRVTGVLELTPGIRSLQIHYDSRQISQSYLVALLEAAEHELPAIDDMEVDSRIVHLPLSWDDPATRLAIDKYMQSVRKDAPWCPSNIEFIRRINGLESVDDVQRIVFDASYLVMGLGDVYLGAPVATPLDPRHRLVTTKYNPARTWTPENAVGIGGAYLCVYGMEGPGGYQFVGRTVQMWNRYRQTADFTSGKQWLLRFFDQIRFYPVTADELLALREDFVHGRFALRTEPATLKLRDYRQFLAANSDSIAGFKQTQQAAFEAERERWAAAGIQEAPAAPDTTGADSKEGVAIPAGCIAVASPVSGSVWQLGVTVGQKLAADAEMLVVEAMKMEIPILADEACEVVEVRCERGRAVSAGETLLVVKPL
ncbi:MAG: urea carboxylase [Steroidobacteraceae bacterium]